MTSEKAFEYSLEQIKKALYETLDNLEEYPNSNSARQYEILEYLIHDWKDPDRNQDIKSYLRQIEQYTEEN